MEGGKEVEGGERSQAQAEGSVVELQAESPTHPPTHPTTPAQGAETMLTRGVGGRGGDDGLRTTRRK